MSQETQIILQSILNSIENPCYVESDGKVILANYVFLKNNFNLEEIRSNPKFELEEKNICNGTKICEIKLNEIMKLNESRQKLTAALSLLS